MVRQVDPSVAPGEEPHFPGENAECLALNIWTPQSSVNAKLPVLVFIHGGSYLYGSGSRQLYRSHLLAAKGLAVVTINYRVHNSDYQLQLKPDIFPNLHAAAGKPWLNPCKYTSAPATGYYCKSCGLAEARQPCARRSY